MNVQHIMLDLETLGTRPGDAILSIGAVKFAPEQGIIERFHTSIKADSCKALGLRAQKSTLEWWNKQSEEARAAAFAGELSIENALIKFSTWLPPKDETVIWGNGANFDNALLAAAYRAADMDVAWHFWNDRCYRTVSAMFMKTKVERVGTGHNALDDAETQALRLLKMQEESGFALK